MRDNAAGKNLWQHPEWLNLGHYLNSGLAQKGFTSSNEVSLGYNHFFQTMRILLTLTILLALHVLGGCSNIFFFPQKSLAQTPDQSGLDYEDVFLESADNVTIHGWWLKARAPVRGTVYFLHGNAENISTHFHNVAWLPEHGYQVFLIDYRGFGKSQGKARLPGALQDVSTGFKFVLDRNTELGKPVYLLGQSLGASMAIYFAANGRSWRPVPELLAQGSGCTGIKAPSIS